jgi:hypothetical protein
MSETASPADVQKRKALVHIIHDAEMLINAPRSIVWRHALNYPAWQNYTRNELVSGTRGAEGEVVILQKNEAAYQSTPYFTRTLKIDPERRIIWKTSRDGEVYFGIIQFILQDLGERTLFINHKIYEYEVEYEDEAEVAAFHKSAMDRCDAIFDTVFPRLKRLAEEEAAQAAA